MTFLSKVFFKVQWRTRLMRDALKNEGIGFQQYTSS